MNWKKNKLIILIVVGMLLGILVGFIINKSITNDQFKVDRTQLEKIKDPTSRAMMEHKISKFEEAKLSEAKKSVAGNYSILSDIFLRMIKMIIAPLVFAVLVIGVAKLGDFKSVGRIG